jgi:hypothetical protein
VRGAVVLAAGASLIAGAYFTLIRFGQAVGEYEEDRQGYDGWVSETDFLVGLAVHLLAPAVLLLLVRLALRGLGSADDAPEERQRDGERA